MTMAYAQYINYAAKELENYINHLVDVNNEYNKTLKDVYGNFPPGEIQKPDKMLQQEKELREAYDNATSLYNDLRRIADKYKNGMNIDTAIKSFSNQLSRTYLPIYEKIIIEEVPTITLSPVETSETGVITDEDDIIELNGIFIKAKTIQNKLKLLICKISEIKGQNYKDMCQSILNYAKNLDNAFGDFARNYSDMIEANTINADKYFHAKANCQAAQRSEFDIKVSEVLSIFRELEEGARKILFEGADFLEQLKDAKEDMNANKKGRQVGKMNKDEACTTLLEDLRPNGLDKKY